MTRRTIVAWLCMVGLLVPLAVISTTPTEPPYVEYQVRGQLMRGDGGPLDQVPIGLVATDGYSGGYHLFAPNGITVTGPNGRFIVSARSALPLDSAAIAVVLPDTFLMGAPFDGEKPEFRQSIEDFYVDDGGFFCSNEVKSRIVGTTYFFDEDTLWVESLPHVLHR